MYFSSLFLLDHSANIVSIFHIFCIMDSLRHDATRLSRNIECLSYKVFRLIRIFAPKIYELLFSCKLLGVCLIRSSNEIHRMAKMSSKKVKAILSLENQKLIFRNMDNDLRNMKNDLCGYFSKDFRESFCRCKVLYCELNWKQIHPLCGNFHASLITFLWSILLNTSI